MDITQALQTLYLCFQLKTVKGENAELSKAVSKALKSIEKLSMEREAMTAQLQQQTVLVLCVH